MSPWESVEEKFYILTLWKPKTVKIGYNKVTQDFFYNGIFCLEIIFKNMSWKRKVPICKIDFFCLVNKFFLCLCRIIKLKNI